MAPGIDTSILNPNSEANVLAKPTSSSAFVIQPSRITTDHESLKFEAAASLQVLPTDYTKSLKSPAELSTQLISSPYNDRDHYLDLEDLDFPSLLFAKALTLLRPIRADYATAPYTEALNFASVIDFLQDLIKAEGIEWKEQSFYVVIFRSQLKDVIDKQWIAQLDKESHREACESGGLLKYWFGSPSVERRNLATCLWRSKEDARKGGLGPWHHKARAAARELYQEIRFTTHRFTILDGAKSWKFEDWVEQ